jgi:hypothetical protein
VGDPCTPENEYEGSFTGFSMTEAYLESRSFQCATRICLVNHFQGRVSCPLGQSPDIVHPCSGPGDESCGGGESCVSGGAFTPTCTVCDGTNPSCVPARCPTGLTCDQDLGVCTCDSRDSPTFSQDGESYACAYFDASCVPGGSAPCTGVLQSYLCHAEGSCQTEGGTAADNQGKACCVPGTAQPVGVPVCGQCDPATSRDAASSVYCSCRCDVADGAPAEPDFNFCTCESGFTCTEIRPNLDLGSPELNGKYCVKSGSAYDGSLNETCGVVAGYHGAPCAGIGP